MTPQSEGITRLLQRMGKGDREAESRLVPLVYGELRRLARHYMRNERVSHTLQATALVHEAYLRLVDERQVNWQNRAHFLGVAAQVMRRILVDHARGLHRLKRGGEQRTVVLEEAIVNLKAPSSDLVALDQALTRLAELDPRQGRIVELRFFGGLTVEETAEVLGISPKTVKRDWSVARAWLYGELNKEERNDLRKMGAGQGTV